MFANGGFKYGEVFVAITLTTLVMSVLAMIMQMGVREESIGQPGNLSELVLDTLYRVVEIVEIEGQKLIWLQKVILSPDRQTLKPEGKKLCYHYTEVLYFNTANKKERYVVLNYEPDAPGSALSVWEAPEGCVLDRS